MIINYRTINYPSAIIAGRVFDELVRNDQELVDAISDPSPTVARIGDDWAVTEGEATHRIPGWDTNNRCEVTEADVWRHLAWCAIEANRATVSVEDAVMVADMLAEMDSDDPRRPAYEIAAKELATEVTK